MSRMIGKSELPRREIKIKPIEFPKTESAEQVPEEALADAKTELKNMQQEIVKLQEQKETMLADLRTEIENEKANWQEEKKTWIESAKQEGYQAGFQEGQEASIAQYRELLQQANNIVDLVKVDYQRTIEQTEDVIMELAIRTAGKILNEKLKDEPERFLNIVKAAVKEISDQSVVSIYLHPVNYETVLVQKPELKRIIGKDTKLSIYLNEELEENSCIIEHPFGEIDASVDTQLGEIRNALKELVMEHEE